MHRVKLFLCNKVYGGVIFVKIIRHGLDILLDLFQIRTLLRNHVALSEMLLAGGQLRLLAVTHLLHSFFHRNSVLNASFYTGNPADGIRMALAYPLAPESICFSVGKDGLRINPVQGKQTRIPAYRNQPHMTALPACSVHCRKMLRNMSMGVKTVHHMKIFCQLRCLPGQICGASPAEDHHIDASGHILGLIHLINLYTFGSQLHVRGIPAGKNSSQLHIRILPDGQLHAFSQVSIAGDTNSYFLHI